MSRSRAAVAFSVVVLSVFCSSAAYAEEKDAPGPTPTQRQIEHAYRECVKEIDAEMAELGLSDFQRQEHRKGEQAACDSSRRRCVEKPRSLDCRGFVEDYASGVGDE